MTATKAKPKTNLLFEGSEWDFDTLDRTHDAIAEIAFEDLGLDIYPNQIEIISTEQMLDAHASLGMPLMYQHWSYGKRFAREETLYRKGYTGLAYEIVINSNPCISYNLEDNTMALQALVMAHAAFGHNHFFKNNYVFQQWTDAGSILDHLQYAKSFVTQCEERHGADAVEEMLDAAHAVMDHAIFRYRRPPEPTQKERKERQRLLAEFEERSFNHLWRTVPTGPEADDDTEEETARSDRKQHLKLPEENLLYFLEQHSQILDGWQREILAIVRDVAQYFYPQRQTKVMNEGCATFVHHYIMNALFDRGMLNEGAMLEILHNHSNVTFQPDFDDPRYSGMNPYALGFAMMQDIQRICVAPTDEDTEWFPEIAGNDDWRGTLKDAWANFRDESFMQQFLSPRLIRKMKLFMLSDNEKEQHYTVGAIHDENGYRKVRDAIARSYDPGVIDPDIQVMDVDLKGDRHLYLQHTIRNGVPLAERERNEVLKHIRRLWGYDVSLVGVEQESGKERYRASTTAEP